MKKVTLTFIVSEKTAANASNELAWNAFANAAAIFEENCKNMYYQIDEL